MKLKVFIQPNCIKCPDAKKLAEKIEKIIPVKYNDISTYDGLSEAVTYDVLATPTFIITNNRNIILKDWRGEIPNLEKLIKKIKEFKLNNLNR